MPLFRRRNADTPAPDPFLADELQAPQPNAGGWGFETGFRLTVQDVFTIAGRGSVVTGRIESGSITAGATVHQVTADLDHGPILDQAVVPILPGDTADLLAARVLTQEHCTLFIYFWPAPKDGLTLGCTEITGAW